MWVVRAKSEVNVEVWSALFTFFCTCEFCCMTFSQVGALSLLLGISSKAEKRWVWNKKKDLFGSSWKMFTISGDRVDRKQEPYSRVSSRGGGDRQSRSQSGNSDLLGGNCGSRGNWKMGGNVSRGIRHSNRFTIISCPNRSSSSTSPSSPCWRWCPRDGGSGGRGTGQPAKGGNTSGEVRDWGLRVLIFEIWLVEMWWDLYMFLYFVF